VGRVPAVAFGVLLVFMVVAGFAGVVVGEVSSLAQQPPEYKYNLQTKRGIGLTLIGIPNAALWGIMTVLLRFIPYLGIVISARAGDRCGSRLDVLVWTALLFVGIELIVSNVVEPLVYGVTTGLSPVALVAAATFWTWLWGPIGLLLSTPLTVCLVVLGRQLPQLQFLDVLLGDEPVLTSQETFYQRILANDPEEATEQAEGFAKDRSLTEFFDEVAMPALARAQADSDRGVVPSETRATFKNTIRVHGRQFISRRR
jgi:hypothetical protein